MSIALPQRRLVSQDDASIIERPDVPRSRFSNQWSLKTAFSAGYLIPIEVEEILPGDHVSYEVTAMVRMATPLFPILDSQRIDTFFFFVPARLLWSNWEKMHGEQNSPADSIAYTVPYIESPAGGFANDSLYDYFGIPGVGQIGAGNTIRINALPLRAYKLIYTEWFKDQNVDTTGAPSVGDGPDLYTAYQRHRRMKSHDYFTSCLPWAQKFTAPTVALGGLAPIIGIGYPDLTLTGTDGNFFETPGVGQAGGAAVPYTDYRSANFAINTDDSVEVGYPQIYADLSEATGVAINTFRLAYMTQQLLERDARGGTRYTESIFNHFRVRNPDFRLQRPEYIGGGQTPLTITPIAQTGVDSADTGLGSLGGAGTAAGQHRASYAATEHGYIIGLINVKTELSYQQGIRKLWTRSTRYDFFYPSFAGLGEQAVLMKEIYQDGSATDDTVFGYQERWHELRTRYSQVTGIMRSTSTGTIDAWHFAQDFSAAPSLNTAFLTDNPDLARNLAAGSAADDQQYLADILFRRTIVRPLPMFGTPATLGRF